MKNTFGVLLAAAGLLYSTAALAEAIQGVVNYVDPANQVFGVRTMGRFTEEDARQFMLLSNKDSPKLRVGQVVNVDATKGPSEAFFRASAVDVTGDVLATKAVGQSA